MPKKHLVVSAIAAAILVRGLGAAPIAYSQDDGRPSPAQSPVDQQVSDLLLNELPAALSQEFKEPTPDNVDHGKQAISLVFNDQNRDMRLVGTFRPLGKDNNRPSDPFESAALRLALTGQPYTAVEEVN